MHDIRHYPTSFPNAAELTFLHLLTADDQSFPLLFSKWCHDTVLDDVDYATMRLLPLIYLRSKRLGVENRYSGRLEGVYKYAWVRNQQLLHTLREVVSTFESAGVRVLTLKGIPLLMLAYKNEGDRFLGDADILIDSKDIKKVISIMGARGWDIQIPNFPDHSYFSAQSIARITKEVTFGRKDGICDIDVHWALYSNTSTHAGTTEISFDTLWQDSTPFDHKGHVYHSLGAEDMLIHVIVHGADHNAHRTLRWVADAVAITTAFSIDWDTCIKKAKEYGCIVEVCVGLCFLFEHSFVTAPTRVRDMVHAIDLSPAQLERYYMNANGTTKAFQGLALLWQSYWRYEAKEYTLINLFLFVRYLARARGFTSTLWLLPFVWQKIATAVRG